MTRDEDGKSRGKNGTNRRRAGGKGAKEAIEARRACNHADGSANISARPLPSTSSAVLLTGPRFIFSQRSPRGDHRSAERTGCYICCPFRVQTVRKPAVNEETFTTEIHTTRSSRNIATGAVRLSSSTRLLIVGKSLNLLKSRYPTAARPYTSPCWLVAIPEIDGREELRWQRHAIPSTTSVTHRDSDGTEVPRLADLEREPSARGR